MSAGSTGSSRRRSAAWIAWPSSAALGEGPDEVVDHPQGRLVRAPGPHDGLRELRDREADAGVERVEEHGGAAPAAPEPDDEVAGQARRPSRGMPTRRATAT